MATPVATRPAADDGSVLGRTVAILEAFDAEHPRRSLGELVEISGLPKSTTYRLAGTLVSLGLLERVDRRYELGLRLFELGGLVGRRQRLRDAALPFMQDLFSATQEAVHLGILEGSEVLYLEKIGGHRTVPLPSRVGGRMPLHCTALGKVILAHSGPELFQRVVAQGLKPRTPYTITVPAVLEGQLREVVRLGHATEREEAGLGFCCVAAPIRDGGRLAGAISVSGRCTRIDPDRIASAVRTAAAGISRALAAGVDGGS